MRRRRGSALLIGVLILLTVVFATMFVRRGRSQALSAQTARMLAAENAIQTASSQLDLARSQLEERLSNPAHPGYTRLRTAILEGLRDRRKVDLTPHLEIDTEFSAFSWKRRRQPALVPVGTVATEIECVVEDWKTLPVEGPVSPDEAVARLSLELRTRDDLAGIHQTCTLLARHELRVQPLAIPRPFSDSNIYFPDLTLVTDAARANAARTRILELRDELRSLVESYPAPDDPHDRALWESLRKGVAGSIAGEIPPLTEEPSALVGPFGVEVVPFQALDLATNLETDRDELDRGLDTLRAARDVSAISETTRQVIGVLNRAIFRMIGMRDHFRLVPHESPEFAAGIAPFTGLLDFASLSSRAMLEMDPDDEAWTSWAEGKGSLGGVVRMTTEKAVHLEGVLSGRVMALVSAPTVSLRALTPRLVGDHLILAIDRGTVSVDETVHASLLLSGRAHLKMGPGATLVGGLYLQNGATMELDGSMKVTPVGQVSRDFTDGGYPRGTFGILFAPLPFEMSRQRNDTGEAP